MRWPERPPHLILNLPCFFVRFYFLLSCVFCLFSFSCFVLFLWVGLCLLFWFPLVNAKKHCFPFNSGAVLSVKCLFKTCFFFYSAVGSCFFVGFCASCFLKLECVVLLSFLQKRHNRLFASLDLVLLFVHHFGHFLIWGVCSSQARNQKPRNSNTKTKMQHKS